jgi:D-alanine-D-alanine ligase
MSSLLTTSVLELGKVAVLLGGSSSERAVSLQSGEGVLAALQHQGVDAHAFDPAHRNLIELKTEGFDRVFIALHGGDGENGAIQGALELLGIPYTGSGIMASAVGMDKWRTKLLWQAAGLPIPPFMILDATTDWSSVIDTLGLPLFVKPATGGSSIGISKVTDLASLKAAYDAAKLHSTIVLAEKAIQGGEFTCAILNNEALPTIRIEPDGDWYDFNAKYISDKTQYHCPSGLPDMLESKARQLALAAFHILDCKDWGRVDFLRDGDDLYLLEANTAPGMTSHSLVPMAAKQVGMSYEALCLLLLTLTIRV